MTVVTRKMLESDLKMIWDSIADNDYIIPSVCSVMKPYLKFSFIILMAYYCLVCIVTYIYGKGHGFYSDLIFSSFFLLFLLFILGVTFYSYSSQYACIDESVKNNSIFFKCARRAGVKIFVVCLILFSLSVLLAFLLVKDSVIVIFPPFLLFISVVGLITFSASMNRYMTPGVISILKRMQEHFSKAAG